MSRVSGVVELVRLMILRGEIGLGGRLVEVPLAARLRVSRSTVREALRQLEGDGLLVADYSGGMRVIEMDERDVTDTLQVRAALEALTAGLAAARVSDGRTASRMLAELEVLSEAADAGTRSTEPESAVLADRRFHRAVAALAGNEPCRDALNRVWDRLVLASAHAVPGARPVTGLGPEHRELLAAIVGGEDEASTIARRHVLAAVA